MKNTIYYLLLTIFTLSSCVPDRVSLGENRVLTIYKIVYYSNNLSSYTVSDTDAKGNWNILIEFKDSTNKFSVGDTIKFSKN
jgi:hypothetical protein